jgi:hypothetical protein
LIAHFKKIGMSLGAAVWTAWFAARSAPTAPAALVQTLAADCPAPVQRLVVGHLFKTYGAVVILPLASLNLVRLDFLCARCPELLLHKLFLNVLAALGIGAVFQHTIHNKVNVLALQVTHVRIGAAAAPCIRALLDLVGCPTRAEHLIFNRIHGATTVD